MGAIRKYKPRLHRIRYNPRFKGCESDEERRQAFEQLILAHFVEAEEFWGQTEFDLNDFACRILGLPEELADTLLRRNEDTALNESGKRWFRRVKALGILCTYGKRDAWSITPEGRRVAEEIVEKRRETRTYMAKARHKYDARKREERHAKKV